MLLGANVESLTRVFFAAGSIAFLQACSTGPDENKETESAEGRRQSAEQSESQKQFAERNPVVKSRIDQLGLTVRLATRAEVPEEDYKYWLYFPAEGAGSLALGMVAGPMYASALVVGGAILLPLGTYGYLHDKNIWDSINQALIAAELTTAIERAMRRRLSSIAIDQKLPEAEVVLSVEAFGVITSSHSAQHCLVIAVHLGISNGQTLLEQDRLHITESNKSKDAPPPQCASLERFADDEARLVKDSLAEYAEVLAAMAVARILRVTL